MKPGVSLPPVVPVSWEQEPFNNIYNASCMFDVRESLLEVLNAQAPGITRPATAGTPSLLAVYIDSIRKSYLFFKAQWTGQLPEGYAEDVPWRRAGFVDLDSSCKKEYLASFATGSARLARWVTIGAVVPHVRYSVSAGLGQAPQFGPQFVR